MSAPCTAGGRKAGAQWGSVASCAMSTFCRTEPLKQLALFSCSCGGFGFFQLLGFVFILQNESYLGKF